MLYRALSSSGWFDAISSNRAPDEVFAWLDAALLALGFERKFTADQRQYLRGGQSVELDLKPSHMGSLVTLAGSGSPFSADERVALELATRAQLTAGVLPGFVAPTPPWLSPEQVVSPYPRLPARRRGWHRLLKRGERRITLGRPQTMLEARFWPDDDLESGLQRLRAIAHFHDWREVHGPEDELRFVRGQPVLPADAGGAFQLPAILRVKVDPARRSISVRMAVWGHGFSLMDGGPKSEMEVLRAYVKVGIRPDGLVRAVGQLARQNVFARFQYAGLAIVLGGAAMGISTHYIASGGVPWLLVVQAAAMMGAVTMLSRWRNPVPYDRGPQPLRPEVFTPEKSPLKEIAPDWAEPLFQHFTDPDSLMRVQSVG